MKPEKFDKNKNIESDAVIIEDYDAETLLFSDEDE